jgi:hypothetical protein
MAGGVRLLMVLAVISTALTSCSSEQLARGFQRWCESAPNCDDKSRRSFKSGSIADQGLPQDKTQTS